MQEVLARKYSAEQVRVALFQMGPTKTPGPDGINAFFYKKFCHVVGDDVITVVLRLFKF